MMAYFAIKFDGGSMGINKLIQFFILIFISLYIQDTYAGGFCSTGAAYTGCGNEANCRCFVQLARAIRGQSVDWSQVAGSGNADNMFRNGGSENIPVTCNAVRYWVNRDPAWFMGYFDAQLTQPDIGFLGTELMSQTYASLVIGDIIAVRKRAEQLGHSALLAKANQWLRAYWALMGLMGNQNPVTRHYALQRNESTNSDVFTNTALPSATFQGYGLALPGNRGYVNHRSGGEGMQHVFLSIALNHPGRNFNYSLDNSPGYYGGLCATTLALGIPFKTNGAPNLQAKVISPSDVGLTSSEASSLQNFIATRGNGLSTIMQYLMPFKLEENLTILRTSEGVMSWFSYDNQMSQIRGSRNKGGSWGGAMLRYSDSSATYISRRRFDSATTASKQDISWVWPEAGKICMKATNASTGAESLPRACINTIAGPTVYKVLFPAFGRPTYQ